MRSGKSAYCPNSGDLIWLDFDPTRGHEQRGRRPALVLSPRSYNERAGLCIACPVTSQVKGYPFEVLLPSQCAVTGVVLSDQMRALSWTERDAQLADPAPRDTVDDVREKIAALIGIV
jgi:mRNA interferase MazF